MKVINVFITIIVFSTFLLPCFAQEDTPEEYIVKVVYFVSKDREPPKDVDAKIKGWLKESQKFFADQLEKHGYGRKTFRVETDVNGDIVVHHVIGKKDSAQYQQDPAGAFGEFADGIQTRNTILFVVLDHGSSTVGGAGGLAFSGARILVPITSGWGVVAHELGHTFSLPHDFRDNSYIMGHGSYVRYPKLSQCAAQWLNVSPYFNPKRITANSPGQIKILPSSIAYPPNQTHAFFEITDPDGLYLVRFLHHHTLMLGCKTLEGEEEIVKFLADTAKDKRVLLEAVDVNGHINYGPWHSLKDLEPDLILDISGDVTDVPDHNSIRGPWLWMIAPTEHNRGGADSTHIDSLAVASANTVNEETVSKAGAREGGTVGDYTWTLGEIAPDGRINVMLVNIGMTENTNLDDWTAYALTTLVSPTDQPNVTMSVRSDDSVKVWLNGEVVWSNAINRGLNDAVDVFPVNLKRGDNLLLVKVSERGGAWRMQVGVDAEVFPVYRVPTTPPVYGVALSGTCDLTPEIINAGADIEYIVTVINTGNTRDTIKLTTSGNTTHLRRPGELVDAGLPTSTTLSRVPLDPGSSSKVVLVVPGFVRATAGDYVVKVAATSESDSTKTAHIITTATIKPFHGVVLSSVDDLTTEITDVNTDVKYAFTVTNTGNVNDTMQLTTELPATLSQESVSLVPGDSSKVTLTIPLTAFTTDDYPINVIATSEGDNTKTDQIRKTVYELHNSIRGPWLWMIAPTEHNRGGAASTHIDSLAVASANTVNEETVSKAGAREGGTVGDYTWTLGEIAPDGKINAMLVNIGMTENTNLDDWTAYALTTLVSPTDQPNVTMSVRSDDSVKVWLNGEVVWSNAINRGLNDAVDVFPVNLKRGDNLLLVKVSERGGAWGMQVGVGADISPVYRVPTTPPVYDGTDDPDTAPKVVFSEFMFASEGGENSLPQWIEVYNNTDEDINLRGWQLQWKRLQPSLLEVTTVFKQDFIISSQQSKLLVTALGRHSSGGNLSNDAVYQLHALHAAALGQNDIANRNRLITRGGFSLKLLTGENDIVDHIGTLIDDRQTWQLPECLINGVRSSLIRRFDAGVPRSGLERRGWSRAVDTNRLPAGFYYGHQRDRGTPGYRRGKPLPVTLSQFSARFDTDRVIINWTTESELNNAGFNILRSTSRTENFRPVNAKLIQGAGTTSERNTYQFIDKTVLAAKPDVAYYYRLEDIDFAGHRTLRTTYRLRGVIAPVGKQITTWGTLKDNR